MNHFDLPSRHFHQAIVDLSSGGSEETVVLLEDSYIKDTYYSAVYLRHSYDLLEPRPVAI